jgi:hypothetical protein
LLFEIGIEKNSIQSKYTMVLIIKFPKNHIIVWEREISKVLVAVHY